MTDDEKERDKVTSTHVARALRVAVARALIFLPRSATSRASMTSRSAWFAYARTSLASSRTNTSVSSLNAHTHRGVTVSAASRATVCATRATWALSLGNNTSSTTARDGGCFADSSRPPSSSHRAPGRSMTDAMKTRARRSGEQSRAAVARDFKCQRVRSVRIARRDANAHATCECDDERNARAK